MLIKSFNKNVFKEYKTREFIACSIRRKHDEYNTVTSAQFSSGVTAKHDTRHSAVQIHLQHTDTGHKMEDFQE